MDWRPPGGGVLDLEIIFGSLRQLQASFRHGRPSQHLLSSHVYDKRQTAVMGTGVYAPRGTTVSGARRQVRAPGPTASMVERASTYRPTSSTASASTRTSVTPASTSTPAARRRVSTAVAVRSSRATATRAAVDPATAASTVASTTRVPARRAFTEAAVLPSQTPPSGRLHARLALETLHTPLIR